MTQRVNLAMTAGIQERIDLLQAELDNLQQRVDDFPTEVGGLGTAAERDVGTAAGNVPDTEILDARLGTTGNLTDTVVYDVTPTQAMSNGGLLTEGDQLPSPFEDGLYEVVVIYSLNGGSTYEEFHILWNFRRADYTNTSNQLYFSPSVFMPTTTVVNNKKIEYRFFRFGIFSSGEFYIISQAFTADWEYDELLDTSQNTAVRKITKLAATGA